MKTSRRNLLFSLLPIPFLSRLTVAREIENPKGLPTLGEMNNIEDFLEGCPWRLNEREGSVVHEVRECLVWVPKVLLIDAFPEHWGEFKLVQPRRVENDFIAYAIPSLQWTPGSIHRGQPHIGWNSPFTWQEKILQKTC